MINTILVIDDSALDNAVIRNILYNERYNIISALNGREALDMIEGRNIDLILLDMYMPVMDGMAFLEEFRKTNYYQTIPVIMTTSVDKTDIIKNVIHEYELFDYVLKPLDSINHLIFTNKIKAALRYRMAIKELMELKAKLEK